jgi:hypothetical protein
MPEEDDNGNDHFHCWLFIFGMAAGALAVWAILYFLK